MINKVLVAEDIDSINRGVLNVLDALGCKDVQTVQYCDDAYLKIKKAISDKAPFTLLITDLSFKADHRQQRFKSGEELIAFLGSEFPDLQVVAYSVEDRLQKIRRLLSYPNVKGYVCKGRNGMKELEESIFCIGNQQTYLSPQIAQTMMHTGGDEIEDYDIQLMKKLSEGLSQEEISNYFKENHISPCSLSSIEKNLNKLKIQFRAKNAVQLVAIVKDLGLI